MPALGLSARAVEDIALTRAIFRAPRRSIAISSALKALLDSPRLVAFDKPSMSYRMPRYQYFSANRQQRRALRLLERQRRDLLDPVLVGELKPPGRYDRRRFSQSAP